MQGNKDFVSIKRNVHKQKQLLLCNLKELYAHFKEQNPDVSIGFQSFVLCVQHGALQLGQVVHTRFVYALIIKTPYF